MCKQCEQNKRKIKNLEKYLFAFKIYPKRWFYTLIPLELYIIEDIVFFLLLVFINLDLELMKAMMKQLMRVNIGRYVYKQKHNNQCNGGGLPNANLLNM